MLRDGRILPRVPLVCGQEKRKVPGRCSSFFVSIFSHVNCLSLFSFLGTFSLIRMYQATSLSTHILGCAPELFRTIDTRDEWLSLCRFVSVCCLYPSQRPLDCTEHTGINSFHNTRFPNFALSFRQRNNIHRRRDKKSVIYFQSSCARNVDTDPRTLNTLVLCRERSWYKVE